MTRQQSHLCPVSVRVHVRVFMLKILMLLSCEPLASSSGSAGLKATLVTSAVCPTNRCSSKPVSASQTMTTLPSPRTSLVPHLEYATHPGKAAGVRCLRLVDPLDEPSLMARRLGIHHHAFIRAEHAVGVLRRQLPHTRHAMGQAWMISTSEEAVGQGAITSQRPPPPPDPTHGVPSHAMGRTCWHTCRMAITRLMLELSILGTPLTLGWMLS